MKFLDAGCTHHFIILGAPVTYVNTVVSGSKKPTRYQPKDKHQKVQSVIFEFVGMSSNKLMHFSKLRIVAGAAFQS